MDIDPQTILSLVSASIVYPTTFLFTITLSVLEYLGGQLLSVASQVSYTLLFPIRILVKLEPLITFFAIAACFGALAGYALHRSLNSVYQALGISATPVVPPQQEVSAELAYGSLKQDEFDDFDITFRNGSQLQKDARTAEKKVYSRWWARSRDASRGSILEEDDEDEEEEL